MQFSELEKRILLSAYQRDLEREDINFNDWSVEQGIDRDEVWRAFDELEENGLVKHRALGGSTEITGTGVLTCEELGLANMARVAQDGKMRTQILDKVAKAREQYGRNSIIPYDVSKPDEPFDEKQWDFNLSVLMDAGLLTHGLTMGSVDITNYGKQVVEEWRKRTSMVVQLEGVQALLPEERSEKLTTFMEKLLAHQQWSVVSRHESGILAQRYGQYYRVRCLWEDEPVGADSVNAFFNVIRQQPAVRGVLISWTGFVEEANKYAVINSSERPIILLQEADIDQLLASKNDLDFVVQSKLDAIIHYHETHPQEMQRVAATNVSDPEELLPFLRRFRQDNPDLSKCVFIMMRFGSTAAHNAITTVIKETLKKHGFTGLRADDKTYSEDLFPNIRTYLHGCAFGIAVFERLTTNDFNPNVSLEVGYLVGLDKPVCLLKDSTLPSLHTDLVGRLYRSFDPQRIEETLPAEVEAWLRDKDLIK